MDKNIDLSIPLLGWCFWCEYDDTTLLPTILMCQCVPIFRVSIGVEKVKTKEGTQALPI